MIEKKRFSEAYFECIILYYSILCVYLIGRINHENRKKGENPPKYDKMTHK